MISSWKFDFTASVQSFSFKKSAQTAILKKVRDNFSNISKPVPEWPSDKSVIFSAWFILFSPPENASGWIWGESDAFGGMYPSLIITLI